MHRSTGFSLACVLLDGITKKAACVFIFSPTTDTTHKNKANSEPCQISKMVEFMKTANLDTKHYPVFFKDTFSEK